MQHKKLNVTPLYPAELIAHARTSPYREKLKNANCTYSITHPQCGDTLTLYAIVTDGTISKIRFEGSGCLISQSAASLYLSHVQDKNREEIVTFIPETLLSMLGVELGLTRQNCALLSFYAVKGLLAEAFSHENSN